MKNAADEVARQIAADLAGRNEAIAAALAAKQAAQAAYLDRVKQTGKSGFNR